MSHDDDDDDDDGEVYLAGCWELGVGHSESRHNRNTVLT